jgi:RNA-directed DNA polymerase
VEKELAELRQQHSIVKDPEKALAQERKRRWDESKKRRAERKVQRAAEAKARREVDVELRKRTVVHAGPRVSAGLQDTMSQEGELQRRGLPVLAKGEELAAAMGIPIAKLRWLTYHRQGAAVVHYHRYAIAKKTGGVRAISAPKKALATAQQWILANILAKLSPEPTAHGFIPGRSIVTNATQHVGKRVVINLDLRDFFPTLTFPRVKGLFRALGYSEHLATVLALLTTEPPRVATEYAGKVYHVSLGERVLPQGACTSPAITNAACLRLDRRLAGLAKKHQFAFTRYADDLTFSGDEPQAVGKLLKSVRSILAAEGFVVHPTKTRVMRRANHQEVTGVTVNQRPTVSRRQIRELRAILHNAARFGLESQNREKRPNFAAHLRGRVAFISMVDPERGQKLAGALARALERP